MADKLKSKLELFIEYALKLGFKIENDTIFYETVNGYESIGRIEKCDQNTGKSYRRSIIVVRGYNSRNAILSVGADRYGLGIYHEAIAGELELGPDLIQ